MTTRRDPLDAPAPAVDPEVLAECVRYFFMLTSVVRQENGLFTLYATDKLGRMSWDVPHDLMLAIVAAKWGAPTTTPAQSEPSTSPR